ncbi:hypothetical protein HRI_003161700 [Hibiscus trionum]|uniref:Uncharacterized protein n=1 Tax=Hibiscus trionum TaxID=183268 RepID=A0A9W7MC52_HIBTR|nr:hypothetical protein HRI_003161700 [Hibiscus trionum]
MKRTKAVKCTKVANVTLDPKSKTISLIEISFFSTINEDDIFVDFLMDFDIDELLVLEHDLISEFRRVQQGDENGDDVGYGNGFDLVMDEGNELCNSMDNSRDGIALFQTSETLDLQSLASYLNTEDEWIN